MLDKRLSVCAGFVTYGGKVCDVGTDHAYLVAELLKSGKCKSAIACDIADGPLLSARMTIEKNGLSDKAEIIKSDGLDNISPDGITDVVIAGMGGELITDIVLRTDWLKNNVNLVLQPMTKPEILRESLIKNGYEIVKEECASDKNHSYTIICFKYTGNFKENVSLKEKWLGRISDNKNSHNIAYAELFLSKENRIIDGMIVSGDTKYIEEHKNIAKVFDDFLKGR